MTSNQESGACSQESVAPGYERRTFNRVLFFLAPYYRLLTPALFSIAVSNQERGPYSPRLRPPGSSLFSGKGWKGWYAAAHLQGRVAPASGIFQSLRRGD